MSSNSYDMPVGLPSSSGQDRHSRHHSRRRRRRRRRIIIVVVCVVAFALVTAGSAFAFTSMIEQGRTNLKEMQANASQIEQNEGATSQDNGKIVEYKGQKYRLNEDMVSICTIGADNNLYEVEEGFNGQADFIMVLAINTKNGKMTGIVIPRDSMVDVDVNYIGTNELYQNQKLQICVAYAYGTDDVKSSELVTRAASRVLYNIPISYYYTIKTDGLYELTDVVDGVVVDPLATIPNTDIVEGESIKLSGSDAAKYVRWRDKSQEGSALERQQRQMQFLKALVGKVLTMVKGNPTKLVEMYNVMSGYATTNLGTSEVTYLATVLANGSGGFDTTTLKGQSVYNEESPWEQYILDKDDVYQKVLDVYYEKV